ncbi:MULTISPECIES: S9 family peptidase [unclassified Leptolyngbya]|uniref:S9 family peptidase n=1 Tax=unclassified Leptolyngbya TaxID=2650499 RepID=UPI0016864C9C|nr:MULTISPECIES: S9 family peptidase [unclassified Leptolyngbya]MBD1911797.1 S9 family peptidase [Leptolyngbya sp. FACHB-8]MBD2153313.1 S9 family peptidase [Leptolyngbya sp. FACHB-16]
MVSPQIAPYGSWKSPITSDLIVAGSVRLGDVCLDGQDIYWSEGRPTEGGRSVVVQLAADGSRTDLTPAPLNVRTRVHEYGGGSYLVADGVVYFSNFADQRIYRQAVGGEPQPITPQESYRYADAVVDVTRDRLICVRENHTEGGHEPSNEIVAIAIHPGDAEDNPGTVLVSGSDFYAYPRISPDGSRLCWIAWDHPNMPWDGTELWEAELLPDGTLGTAIMVAGSVSESIFQPSWSPDGVLHFVSDRTGWWNLYRWNRTGVIEPLCPKAAEFGLPLWVFGMSTYGFESVESLICTYSENGLSHLARLNLKTLELEEIPTPYASVGGVQVGNGFVVFGGGTPTQPGAIARLNLATGECEALRRSSDLTVDPAYISVPEPIEFPTENGLTAYGFFYPPQNADFAAPEGELPPLLVKSHGGPTAATSATFNPGIQYWTSRGIAVLDVNYGGSTGYGREYRDRLKGNWGIVDVDDCVNGARYLAKHKRVDGDRLCIDGGSAGGYTTLAALAFRDVFKAGASYYGVSDLEALARDTHKFESRYLDGLIGPYPEAKEVYEARSPIHHIDKLSCPVIFFQGDEDKIVPPNQAEMMVNALKEKGLPVAYVLYEGEQHGFRKSENIKRTLDGELYFYAQVFGFALADEMEKVAIANL